MRLADIGIDGGASRLWMELDKVEALRSFWSSF